jgi:pyruvate/2-oxoglutarate dehydrogenase complex dihydrolipoamide acyltransferase (E2) component
MLEVTIPKLGLTMESATLVEWRYESGEHVKRNETIALIETEKVTYEITAPGDGILHPVVDEGAVCKVNEVIGYIAQNQEEYENIKRRYPSPVSKKTSQISPGEVQHQKIQKRIKASPLARAIAKEHGLNLQNIRGTGPGGRITKTDVLSAIEEQEKLTPPKTPSQKETLKVIPIKGTRKRIFDNMYMSISQSAQLTLHTHASAQELVKLRDRFTGMGKNISYNAIFIKITAMALGMHPMINSSVDGDKIRTWKQINIGLAMEKDDELIVPVIRNPDTKSILEIERDLRDLIKKARENNLTPDDLSNGTFTISNLGFAGIEYFTPIIRPPESAILGIGAINTKAVVKEDSIVPDPTVGLSLTFDHRIIDGAPAARFLKTIKDIIEEPILLLLMEGRSDHEY